MSKITSKKICKYSLKVILKANINFELLNLP